MSTTERVILGLLRDGERFGLELIAASAGTLKRGTIYVTLGRMERKGFVTSRQDTPVPGAIGLPRRVYSATAYGLKVFDAYTTLHDALGLKPAEAQ